MLGSTALRRGAWMASAHSQPLTMMAVPSTSSVAAFHTSTSALTIKHSRKSKAAVREKRKAVKEMREVKKRIHEVTKPDPALGHRLDEDGRKLWKESELCKVILTKDAVWGVESRKGNLVKVPGEGESNSSLIGPERLNFGLDNETDRALLFSELPAAILEDRQRLHQSSVSALSNEELQELSRRLESDEEAEKEHRDLLGRILDLRNASGKGIQVENIRRIVHHFGARTRPDGSTMLDTGCPEVQAAVMTYKIRNMHEHLSNGRHDDVTRRAMRTMIHQRVKILRYLKRESVQRFQAILPRLGLQPRAVEGEIVVPGKPLLKTMTQ